MKSLIRETFTRTTYMLIDTGTLPTGTTEQQIDGSTEQNFESQKVLNQAIRRYNQVFTGMQTVTIAGDFSLHAGDVVFFDKPNPLKKVMTLTRNQGVYIL